MRTALSNKKRTALYKDLAPARAVYVCTELKTALAESIGVVAAGCTIIPDEDDGLTLLVEYPSLYPGSETASVSARVKIEAGARSALTHAVTRSVVPYITHDLPD